MQVELRKSFSGKIVLKNTGFTFDKTSKLRPAWIFVENLPRNIMFLSTRVDGKIHHYRVYLSTAIPLFLPVNYTKAEMKKFYGKFAIIYDKEVEKRNTKAAEFLFDNIKILKGTKILDLGAGTGVSSVPIAKKGYENITLLDFSKEMLSKARQKNELRNCRFICQDISKLKFNNRFDVIFSVFSFASNSYFNPDEMPLLWKKVVGSLKQGGILMLVGYDFQPPESLVRKVRSGSYEIIKGHKASWYIGKKKT